MMCVRRQYLFRSSLALTLLWMSACSSKQKTDEKAVQEVVAEEVLEEVDVKQSEDEKKQAEEEQEYSLKDNPNEITDDNPLPQLSTKAGGIYQDATELFLKEDYEEASRLYERAGQEIENFYAAYFNAGVSSEMDGDRKRAEKMYRKAIELKPYHAQSLVNLYKLLRNQGKITDANNVIDGALQKMNDRAGPHVAAATRARLDGRVDETEREARAAMRYDERQVEAMRLMGWVFSERGQYETSKFALDNALVLEPGNALLHLDLAFVYLELEEEDKALSSFETAVKLNPNLGEAQEYYAILILKKGDRDKAMRAMERAIKLRSDSAWAQLHYGNILRANGRYDEALTAYSKAESMDTSIKEVHFNRGVLYLDNEVKNLAMLDRLNASRDEFAKYRESDDLSSELRARLDDYESAVDKKIKREERRIKREADRKAEEAKEAAGESDDKDDWDEDDEDGEDASDAESKSASESSDEDEDDWGDEEDAPADASGESSEKNADVESENDEDDWGDEEDAPADASGESSEKNVDVESENDEDDWGDEDEPAEDTTAEDKTAEQEQTDETKESEQPSTESETSDEEEDEEW